MTPQDPPTLAATLAEVWQRSPQRPALVCPRHRLTYGDLRQAVHRLIGTYRQLGLAPGDRIVCSVGNRCEHIVAMVAAWTHAAVHVAIDHRSTAAEIAAIVERTGASALVYEPPCDHPNPYETVDAVRRRHPRLHVLVVADHPVPHPHQRWTLPGTSEQRATHASRPGAAAIAVPAVAEPPVKGPAPEDPAIVFISSGTTGTPKATVGFHGNLARRWRRLTGWLRFGPDDVHLAQLPLSHGFGMMMAVAALLGGGSLVLLDPFSAEAALDAVDAEGITVLNGSPAHFTLLLRKLDPDRHRVSTLRFSVGTAAPFPARLVDAIRKSLGVEFMLMYGSSEGVGVATTDIGDILRGSVGRPEPGSVQVVGPNREPLPAGEVGEVAFSRKVYPVRYWGAADRLTPPRPPATANGHASADWYYSGDLGRLDDEGRLYIHGRIKHQIDRGGLKVDPVEVELALLRCPDVAEAAVIGQPNPVLGETVCACITPAPGRAPTLAELRAELSETLAPFKLPEQLHVLDGIPRTPIGKVDLPRLRGAIAPVPPQRLIQR